MLDNSLFYLCLLKQDWWGKIGHMSETLYRKYRPQKFSDVAGQEAIIGTLMNQLKQGKVSHAYLFVGPRGVGKTTTARLFAAAIESQDGGELPAEILSGKDIDVIEIDAASYSKVENVREIILENVRVTPARRAYKIFIIDEVHMLSTAAFNALLKVIEEPPVHVIFILATTELHKVPATIVSRCQRYDFKRITNEIAIEVLKKVASAENAIVADEVLIQIVRHADGSLRDAESILGQLLATGQKEITIESASALLPPSLINQSSDLLELLSTKQAQQALEHLHNLVEQGLDLNQLCHDILEVSRQIMLTMNGVTRKHFTPAAAELAKKFSSDDLLRIINLISQARLQIRQSYLPQLPLEVAIVQYCTLTPVYQAPRTIQPQTPSAPTPATTIEQPEQTAPKTLTGKKTIERMPSSNIAQASQISGTNTEQINLTIDKLKNTWHKFLSALQVVNASLVLILKTAEPMRINGNQLYIGLKYPFHKDRIQSNDSRLLLEEQLLKYFGEKMSVVAEVLPSGYASDFLNAQNFADEVELVADTTSASNASLFVSPATQISGQPSTSNALIEHLVQTFGGKILET